MKELWEMYEEPRANIERNMRIFQQQTGQKKHEEDLILEPTETGMDGNY